MSISLAFRNQLQFVRYEGRIVAEEEAAVRLKLDQKINQNRNLLLFDIIAFDMSDPR